MNSRERFFNMVVGKPVDRRPFGALMSLYGAALTGCPPERFYNDAAAYARGQDAVRQTIAPDFLFGPFFLAGYGEAFGSTLRYTENYVPNIHRPAIASSQGISALKIPDFDAHPRLLYVRESIRRIAANHGREAIIIGTVLNPLDLPLVIMGLDAWLGVVLTDEEATRRMLDITIPFFVGLCEKLFADGADVLAMPMAFFTKDITTRRLVADFALPALREAVAQVKGPLVFHHTGSSFFEHIDLLDGLPGVAGFTMDVHDDMAAARTCIRKETILFGGLDGPSLHTFTPDEIRARCLTTLTELRDDPRHVLFATGTDVEVHTPPECLIAMRQAVEEYGNG